MRAAEVLSTIQRGPFQLAAAVSYLHYHNVIHGDIGSHNILVGEEGQLLLCDLGGSKIDNEQCSAFPSARYRRLAQHIRDRDKYNPGPKDDIFAVGMVAFELLSAHIAWSDLTHDAILVLIATKSWPDVDLPLTRD